MGWDDVEKVLHHTFYNELRVAPEEHPAPAAVREKYCQIIFETFSAPAAYFAHPAVLSLMSSGRFTGLSVMSGHKGTFITPVYCGHALDYLTQKVDIAGHHVTTSLVAMLGAEGYSFTTTAEMQVAADIKDRCCRVALDYDSATIEDKIYTMPDGSDIQVGRSQFAAAEIIFQPHLFQAELDATEGIQHKIVSVVESCMPFMRSALYGNIVLSGGNTLFPGFEERLQKELRALVPERYREASLKIIASPDRKYMTWIGGSILGSLPCFPHMCISKEEYDEFGPTMVARKCF